MSDAVCSWFKWSFLGLMLLAAAGFGRPVDAQSPPPIRVGGVQIHGIPHDWSDHYVVFSDPGTEREAIVSGQFERWQRIVNDPRYVLQQLKRNAAVQGPAAAAVEFRSRLRARRDPPASARRRPGIRLDWRMTLGGPGLAPAHYPAKFTIDPTSANCNDYVVFPTGVAGSGSHATIVAFTNLYPGGCTGSVPSVKWAYNTGGTADLSPVVSLDGTQVVFIQRSSATPPVASLVILKMANSGGSVTVPAAITQVTQTQYSTCTAPCFTTLQLAGSTTQPTNSGTVNDTNSAPFYRYFDDVLYVGDDSGIGHRFNPVFNGPPAETGNVGTNPAPSMGWPALVQMGFKLTSPVFDFQPVNTGTDPACITPVPSSARPPGNTGCEPRVWIGDANGHLNWINTSPPASQFVNPSSQLACTNSTNNASATGTQVDIGIVDPALVDATNGNVYAFVGYGCTSPSGAAAHSGFIGRFAKNNVPNSSEQQRANYNGTSNPPSSPATVARIGDFDDIFLSGGNVGNIYACVDGRVFQARLNATGVLSPTAGLANIFSTPVSTVSNASACLVTAFTGAKVITTLTSAIGAGQTTLSLLTTTGVVVNDFLQLNSEITKVSSVTPPTTVVVVRGQFGTTPTSHGPGTDVVDINDRLFMSVLANGNATVSPACTGPCVYNYNITAGNPTGNPTAGLLVSGTILGSGSQSTSTSGIIIDNNSSLPGAQQIYFSTRTNPSFAQQALQSTLQ